MTATETPKARVGLLLLRSPGEGGEGFRTLTMPVYRASNGQNKRPSRQISTSGVVESITEY